MIENLRPNMQTSELQAKTWVATGALKGLYAAIYIYESLFYWLYVSGL